MLAKFVLDIIGNKKMIDDTQLNMIIGFVIGLSIGLPILYSYIKNNWRKIRPDFESQFYESIKNTADNSGKIQ